jgi:hypothetical protein
MTDSELPIFLKFPILERLDLDRVEITDKGLETLKGMTQLKTLSLVSTPITDEGRAIAPKVIVRIGLFRDMSRPIRR